MRELVEELSQLLRERKLMLAAAESCTGGQFTAAITRMPGASDVFERGFVTYSNASKTEMLGVPEDLIKTQGAVSAEAAESMARGALKRSRAGIAISITGIAGPDGGSKEKPVGLIYIGHALKDEPAAATKNQFSGARAEIQAQAVAQALKQLISLLRKNA